MIDFKKVFIDTAPYIYFFNRNDRFYERTKAFLSHCVRNDIPMVSSVITLAEYSVKPYRDDEKEFLDLFYGLLNDTETEIMDIDEHIADEAAMIRAKYVGFKAMDALQLASAMAAGADLFLTNDRQLRQFVGMTVMTLDELPEEDTQK
ncbi:MAG: PIN domain-containing protein [Candidatus Gastranaerophilales bacterium]|nr:PIN domain-containing protein [Candidatus Gastranaerophilales bacterium]